MKVQYIVNNYTLGAKVKTTPKHKLVDVDRIDRNHTKLIYSNLTQQEKEFTDKVLAQKGKVE
mgnify:CR=1 FL=1